jgi:hypothetical protein
VPKRHQGFVQGRLVLAPGSSMSSMKASDHKRLNLVLDRIAGGLREGVLRQMSSSESSPTRRGSKGRK